MSKVVGKKNYFGGGVRPLALAVQLAIGAVAIGLATESTIAHAQVTTGATTFAADVPPGPLGEALNRFALQAGVSIVIDAQKVKGKTTQGVKGVVTVEAGFQKLLAGSGFQIGRSDSGYVLVEQVSQTNDSDAGRTLQTVSVTAAKDGYTSDLPAPYAGGQTARGGQLGMLGNKDFLDTPFATTSYTTELIANQNATTVADVLQNDPSVRYTTPAGHMVENYFIRGFLVTSDNIAMNGMYGVAPYAHVPIELAERVEILKGPATLLYGMSPSGAVGGTINLVTKKAGDEPLNQVSLDYVSKGQLGTRIDMGRRLGEDKEIGIRFNGAYREGQTEIDEQSKSRRLAALGLDYRGRKGRVSLDIYDDKEKTSNGSPTMVSFSSQVVAAPDSSTNLFKGTFGDLENRGVLLRGDYELDTQTSVYSGFGRMQSRFNGFINGTQANNVTTSGSYTGTTAYVDGFYENVSYEAGVRRKFATGNVGHEVNLAATRLSSDYGIISKSSSSYASNIYNPSTPLVAISPGTAPVTQETRLTGVAIADTLSMLEEKVAVTIALRRQNMVVRSYSSTTGSLTGDYDKTVTTPSIGLVVKPWSPNVSLYANYIQGLAKSDSPSSTTTTTTINGKSYTITNPGAVFDPYVVHQREIGAKWDAGNFAHTMSVYEVIQPMLVYNQTSSSTVTASIDGEKVVRGLEWTTMGAISSSVRILGGTTLASSTQRNTSLGIYDGKEAYGVPHAQANLGLDWDTPWVPALTLSGRVVYTSAQYLDYANTLEIPAWTRYDVGARYKTTINGHDTVFTAYVTNLLDSNYWVGVFHAEKYTSLSSPRTLSLSATMNF